MLAPLCASGRENVPAASPSLERTKAVTQDGKALATPSDAGVAIGSIQKVSEPLLQEPTPAQDEASMAVEEQQPLASTLKAARDEKASPAESPAKKVARIHAEPAGAEQQQPCTAAQAQAAPLQQQPVAEEHLLVKKLSEHATVPVRGSAGAAGYDLSSAYDCVVPARGKALVKTDIAIKVPKGTYGRVAPRSGLASKHFIDTGAGVVDEDYRGNVGVLLFNHSDQDFAVKKGDRVAQLVLERIAVPDVHEVESLDATERGANGYGSTGVAAKA